MRNLKLYAVILGATVPQRLIEQHDVVFAAAPALHDLIPTFQNAWPEGSSVHIDAWREINVVGKHTIALSTQTPKTPSTLKLYFFNLGGYVQGDMEEHHHKMLVVAENLKDATAAVKQSEFYQNRGYEGAVSHIDDKMSVDIDDVVVVNDLLARENLHLHIAPNGPIEDEDSWQVGYLSLSKLSKRAASLEAVGDGAVQ